MLFDFRAGLGFGEDRLMQLRVFHFRLFQDRNVGVCVLPKVEEVLVGGFGFNGVAGERVRTAQLQMGQRTDGFVTNDSSVTKNFLELSCGFGAAMSGEVRHPSYVDGI